MVKVDDFEVVEGLHYSKEYEWVRVEDGKVRIGVTEYAQKQLREIVFAELPSAGDEIKKNDAYGTVESVKAVSDLIAPISGKVDKVNDAVLDQPELINEDPFNKGWLLLISPTNLKAELNQLMDFKKAVEWHKELIKEG
ncbi:MAG: glycine cleavage system protein GcvH [Candidatus Bathyarchaeota archaeon]|nr:MAG: glycine cleavage system protein GcvH [Candidatus Bathyarchaeota archaeon]